LTTDLVQSRFSIGTLTLPGHHVRLEELSEGVGRPVEHHVSRESLAMVLATFQMELGIKD